MKEAVKLGMEISLLIVEDEKKFAALLQSIFWNHPDISHVETVHDAETAAEKLRESTYDVVLTDFRLPGADGFELMCSQDGSEKAPPFVVMTSFDTDEALLESYSLGAMGYVPKTAGPEAFVSSVVNAAVGKKTIEADVAQRILANSFGSPRVQTTQKMVRRLKPEDQRVLRLLVEGHSNSEIAHQLHYAESTIKQKVRVLFDHFGVTSRTKLIARLQGVPLGLLR